VALAAGPAAAQVSPEARRELQRGINEFQEKRYGAAQTHFRKAVELAQSYTPTAEDYLSEAGDQIDEGNVKEAEAAIDRALGVDPKSAHAYFLRGYLARRTGHPQQAFDALDRALQLRPDFPRAAGELWKLLEAERKFGLAVQKFGELADKVKDNPILTYYLGRAYLANGNFEKAEETLARAVRLDPEDEDAHQEYLAAMAKLPGTSAPAVRYEELVKEFPRSAMVKLVLAQLYVDRGDTEKAVRVLRQISQDDTGLDPSMRLTLARKFEDAGDKAGKPNAPEYALAAEQIARVLGHLKPKSPESLRATFNYGRVLVKAGKVLEGLERLKEAEELYRQIRQDRPMPVLFQLGNAYRLAGDKGKAEEYFRAFLRALEETNRPVDPESAEHLGDIYLADRRYNEAVQVLQRAVASAREFQRDANPDPKEAATLVRLQYKLAQALLGQKAHESCITQALKIVEDRDFGPRSRLLLARAYLADNQPEKALDQLRTLEGSPAWDQEASAEMGRALLAGGRADEALPYIENAYKARPADEPLSLLYAKVLIVLDRIDEARALFEAAPANRRSDQAWLGLGDLELHIAEGLEVTGRADHLKLAVDHYKKALSRNRADPDIKVRLEQAEKELIRTETALKAHQEKVSLVLITGGLILAVLIPTGLASWFGWRSYRAHWADRRFKEVLALEHDLKTLIRTRARQLWQEDWQDRLLEECRERVNGRQLKSKLNDDRAKGGVRDDVLSVCNFGHLVGMLDCAWDSFGLEQVSVRGTRKLILASLSYVGDCRNAIFHGRELEELQKDNRRTRERPVQHMNEQIFSSIHIVRQNLELRPGGGGGGAPPPPAAGAPALPVLAPADAILSPLEPGPGAPGR
jgi:tetratricopeptide (TPR) repeat protein